MFPRLLLLYCFLSFFCLSGLAQSKKVSNALSKYEVQLLDIISSDSLSEFSLKLDKTVYKFGFDEFPRIETFLIKSKRKIFLQPLGTGKLYTVFKTNNQYQLQRLDSSIYFGANFFAHDAYVRDTLFQYAGSGYWNVRGIISYFSNETYQWELFQTNKAIPNLFDDFRKTIAHLNYKDPNPKLYISNSIEFENFPKNFNMSMIDSCFEFDFNNKEWSTKGALNTAFIKIKEKRESSILSLGDDFVFESQLSFYWANFATNSFGLLKNYKSAELRQKWLETNETYSSLPNNLIQFRTGNKIYIAKINNQLDLVYKTIEISNGDFDLSNIQQIYTPISNNRLLHFFSSQINMIIGIISTLFLVFLAYTLNKKKNKKVKISQEMMPILNNNFFSSLSIMEKELVEVLLKHQQKGEEISTKLINKIIGVQQKDTLTQNKSRSDYFIKINQKYRLATQQEEPLIIKNRDAADKRQYNYTLNEKYIKHIEKLFAKLFEN